MRTEPVPTPVVKSPYKAAKKKSSKRKTSKEHKHARAEKEQLFRVLRTVTKRTSTLASNEAIIQAVLVDAPEVVIVGSEPITPITGPTESEDVITSTTGLMSTTGLTLTTGLIENEDAIANDAAVNVFTSTQGAVGMRAKIQVLETMNLELQQEKDVIEARCNQRLRDQDRAHIMEINQMEQYYRTRLHVQSEAHEQEMRQLNQYHQGIFPDT